jgi:RNase H-fold protein (predicted Holliday junction resolvase)
VKSPAAPVVLAIDPGSEKCGIAVVRRCGDVPFRAIVPACDLVATTRDLIDQFEPCHIVCGRGTGSKAILSSLLACDLSAPVAVVDESYTSEEARRRYVAENPPQGWDRLLPPCLRTPRVPYDDYVAVILAERFWLEQAAVAPEAG